MKAEDYADREQAFVKHFVLSHYLQKLALKVGQFQPGTTLNYIDGFSGPWDAKAEGFKDSSPYIAAAELRKARATLGNLPNAVDLNVRCMFVERDRDAYNRLSQVCQGFEDIECQAFNNEFESLIAEAVRFGGQGAYPFAFVFIDPTGWTGFGLERIAPLLRVQPSEVLINFMTKDVRRFINDQDSSAGGSFRELYWEDNPQAKWDGLTGPEREDAIVGHYCRRVSEVGGFAYSATALILNPKTDRTHYHLVYATRSLAGLATFREVEETAARAQGLSRANAKETARQRQTKQGSLFAPELMDTNYLDQLRGRYHRQAQSRLETLCHRRAEPVYYDELLGELLTYPFVSERVVKAWLTEMKTAEQVEFFNLGARGRIVKRGKGHVIRWIGG